MTSLDALGSKQTEILRILHRNKMGVTTDQIAAGCGISRNAVRQHLTALERDGFIEKGDQVPTAGRPQQNYVLSPNGREAFARQYSWFANLLVEDLVARGGKNSLTSTLNKLAKSVAASWQPRMVGPAGSRARLEAIAAEMTKFGYDAAVDGPAEINAHNCVYHDIAARNPDVCSFDTALLEETSGCKVEHTSCMVRGGNSCRFKFKSR